MQPQPQLGQEPVDPELIMQALAEQRDRAHNEAAMSNARANAYLQEVGILRQRVVELEASDEKPQEPAPKGRRPPKK